MLLDPTGHVVWAEEIAHLKQLEREGAPHTNDVTFLLTTHVSSFELQLRSEERAEWLTRRFP